MWLCRSPLNHMPVKPFVASVSYVAFKAYFGLALPGTYIAFKAFLQVRQSFLGRQQGTKIESKKEKHTDNAILTMHKRQFW